MEKIPKNYLHHSADIAASQTTFNCLTFTQSKVNELVDEVNSLTDKLDKLNRRMQCLDKE